MSVRNLPINNYSTVCDSFMQTTHNTQPKLQGVTENTAQLSPRHFNFMSQNIQDKRPTPSEISLPFYQLSMLSEI